MTNEVIDKLSDKINYITTMKKVSFDETKNQFMQKVI